MVADADIQFPCWQRVATLVAIPQAITNSIATRMHENITCQKRA
jgi:hypothetical protein